MWVYQKMNIKLTDKQWNIVMICGLAGIFGLLSLIGILDYQGQEKQNLIFCHGKAMPFDDNNETQWAGVTKCDNGTMMKVTGLTINNHGNITYAGTRMK